MGLRTLINFSMLSILNSHSNPNANNNDISFYRLLPQYCIENYKKIHLSALDEMAPSSFTDWIAFQNMLWFVIHISKKTCIHVFACKFGQNSIKLHNQSLFIKKWVSNVAFLLKQVTEGSWRSNGGGKTIEWCILM